MLTPEEQEWLESAAESLEHGYTYLLDHARPALEKLQSAGVVEDSIVEQLGEAISLIDEVLASLPSFTEDRAT